MGKLQCGMQSTQSQQWNNGIVKRVTQNRMSQRQTIFHYVHCVSLSIFNMLTQSFSVLKVSAENVKRYTFDKSIQLQG